jgi:hypothetical protein
LLNVPEPLRTSDPYAPIKLSPSYLRQRCFVTCGSLSCSKLWRQIAVDLEADADLNDGRSRPSHDHFLLYFVTNDIGSHITKIQSELLKLSCHSLLPRPACFVERRNYSLSSSA